MHIVLVYRYYNDGIVYYNLTFCTRKSLMTDLGLNALFTFLLFYSFTFLLFQSSIVLFPLFFRRTR